MGMLLNGESYGFSRIKVSGFPGGDTIGSLFVSGLRGIECSDSCEIVKPMGAGAIALPSGPAHSYTVTSSLEIVSEVFEACLPSLPAGYNELRFDLTALMGKVTGAAFLKRELKETRIMRVDENWRRDDKEGPITKLTLDTRYLLRQGKCLITLED